ncbi:MULTISPECIES: endolytic transglycosylase MltG [Streptococcus]|uniref:endolytic transglycosylase MltG n=1 Tax=Streptococcus TaxID=1301 RepID=UPI0003D39E79|nr:MULTISPECIES: endolytic transglycosylase MltG [Streptococcus]ETE04308.1 aminodeoxychorismate lyase [Streptococcus pseudopneumoniae 22725]KPL38728.1 aminodeoxychorismate lyase [Streptococcus pseudopneumoniae]KPL39749.1 aminodeoxychorismate lyase [Streptococcus pseudopneumoniae]KPL43243.1 aminodeoxychorismate lyase [Streptococcus pseudopneumoniae]MBF9679371.1 endolytic transglycosylase MltG [Streptococcus pseudopneumoniae]
MSEKSREEEKLSFKEQILRDLEKVKSYDEVLKEDNAVVRTPANEPSAEELMADSLSTVEEIMRKAPTVPTHPSQNVPASPADEIQREIPGVPSHPSQDVPSSPAEESGSRPGPGPVRPKKLEREYNETPTRVAVSYKTAEKKAEQAGSETPTPATETVDIISDTPRRSRREGAKPVKSKKEKKSHVKAFVISFLVFLALLSAGGYFGYQYVQSSLQPVDASSKQYVTVGIPEGSNVQEIGTTLEKAGLVKHGLIFSFYAKYKNYTDLKAGYYNLQKSMSTEDLLKELQKGGTDEPQEPVLATLTIPEGYTLDQIAQAVGQLQGDFKEPLTADAFLAKVQDENFISQAVAKYPTLLESLPAKDSGARYRLEGYLFPATYSIKESTTVESLIDEMLAAMDKNLSPYYSTIKSKNLTVNELLTIASLVEKEGAKTEDRKLIAGVFYNRLNRDMPLQSNIAILYAQGKLGQNISLAEDVAIDTNIDSPYNVYKNVGLMPGPVDSPSLDAIESSINQTKSDNLYFVADVTEGKVYYANNQEDHDRNVAEHVNSKLNQTN